MCLAQGHHRLWGSNVFMLNSAEQQIYPAHKCSNANCWHLNISAGYIQHLRDLVQDTSLFVGIVVYMSG